MEKVIQTEEIASLKVKFGELNIIQYDGELEEVGVRDGAKF